jgi:hypothetical protein
MNTNQLTIEKAREMVEISVGDVFSREAVLSLLARIKVQEGVDMDDVQKMIHGCKAEMRDEIESSIKDGFNDLVDYDDTEFRIEGHNEIVLDNVGFNSSGYVFNDVTTNVMNILLDACDKLKRQKEQLNDLEDQMEEMSNSNTESNEQGEVC